MQKKEKSFSVGDFMGVMLRRKRAVLAAAAVVSALVFVVAIALPDSYKSQTMLMIDSSKYPEQFNNNLKWFPPVDERLETLFQAARSKRELRAICEKFGLYQGKGALDRLMAQLVGEAPERLSRDLLCDVLPPPPNRPKEQRIIQVAFSSSTPRLAADVVNAFSFRLADIEHEFSLAHFDEAIAFLETSARASREALDQKARQVLDWKQLHEDSLPDHAVDLRHELDALGAAALAAERQVSEAESRIEGYSRTIDTYVQQVASGTLNAEAFGLLPGTMVDRRVDVLRQQIGELKMALVDLRIKNFDTHPDVRRVAALLAAAETEHKVLTEGLDAAKKGDGKPAKGPEDPERLAEVPASSPLFPAYEQFVNLRAGERKQVEILRHELVRVEGERARVALLLAKVPETERGLATMLADHLALQKIDDERETQLDKARTMRDVESQRKTEQLRVIEPAEPSPLPDGPDRLKIAMLGVLLALGAGGGLAFLKETRDTSFRTAEDAAERLEAPVLVSLPRIGG